MTAPLGPRSSVCALVPHHACEPWLDQALRSLLQQTRPPEAIVVIDDGSPQPPAEIVAAYPEVTLLRTPDNGGPYRLVQAVIDRTGFDAYLFQDADDWSAPDRLEALLAESEATGAELVGSHEVRVMSVDGDVLTIAYPRDVNAALAATPSAYPLLHPTSLVGRELVERVGGYASGMRFSGDAEFLRRAAHVAKVVNVDHYGYFRRKRPGSLTTAPSTALDSPRRRAVQRVLANRARANAAAVAAGREPDLRPLQVAAPVALEHVCGPPLRTGPPPRRLGGGRRTDAAAVRASAGRSGRQEAAATATATTGSPYPHPVFVVGAPRSGQALLAWALGQHPSLTTVIDPRWMGNLAADIEHHLGDEHSHVPGALRRSLAAVLAEAAGGPAHRRPVAGSAGLTGAVHALSALLPEARFVHVVRDAGEVVASLREGPSEEGVFHTGDDAWRAWAAGVEAALDAEAALGSDTVLRLRYEELVTRPRETMADCLAFVGEKPVDACVRPLLGLEPVESHPRLTPDTPELADSVADVARRLQEPTAPEGDALARRDLARRFSARRRATGGGATLTDRLTALVAGSTPEGARVAVVSKGDPRLVDLPEREGWHYPQVDGGTYAGFHPADSEDAIRRLRRLQERGADHLAVPATAFWWLEFYEGLRDHLEDSGAVVAFHAQVGVVYRLSGTARETGWRVIPRSLSRVGGDRR